MVQMPGIVVAYVPNRRYGRAHEQATRAEIARRLAVLKRFSFAGEFEASRSYSSSVYSVPSDIRVGSEAQPMGHPF